MYTRWLIAWGKQIFANIGWVNYRILSGLGIDARRVMEEDIGRGLELSFLRKRKSAAAKFSNRDTHWPI